MLSLHYFFIFFISHGREDSEQLRKVCTEFLFDVKWKQKQTKSNKQKYARLKPANAMQLPFRSVCHTDVTFAKEPAVQSVSSWPSVCKEHGLHCVRERYINSTQRQDIYLATRRFKWCLSYWQCAAVHKISAPQLTNTCWYIYISIYIYLLSWVKGVFRNV